MSEYEYSKFGEWLRNGDEVPDELSKDFAEIQDDTISELLLYLNWLDTEGEDLTELLKSKGYNYTVSKALAEDKEQYLQVLTGLQGETRDISGYRTIRKLEREWRLNMDADGVTKYILYGEEGSGKTDFALFKGLEIAPIVANRIGHNTVFISNVKVENADKLPIDRVHYTQSTTELESLIEDYKGEDMRNWEVIIFLDEGAQLFSGHGSSQHRGQYISNITKLLRKANGHIMISGQTGMDITKDIRRNYQFIHKYDRHNPDRVRVGTEIDNDGNITDERFSFKGAPPTNANYNTFGEGEWTHDVGGDDENEEAQRARQKAQEKQEQLENTLLALNDSGLTYRNIEDRLDIPRSTVGDYITRAKKRREKEDNNI